MSSGSFTAESCFSTRATEDFISTATASEVDVAVRDTPLGSLCANPSARLYSGTGMREAVIKCY